ncbi:MAG: hypothetical protein WCG78_03695 [Candidatus Omnitrophota bacterium]
MKKRTMIPGALIIGLLCNIIFPASGSCAALLRPQSALERKSVKAPRQIGSTPQTNKFIPGVAEHIDPATGIPDSAMWGNPRESEEAAEVTDDVGLAVQSILNISRPAVIRINNIAVWQRLLTTIGKNENTCGLGLTLDMELVATHTYAHQGHSRVSAREIQAAYEAHHMIPNDLRFKIVLLGTYDAVEFHEKLHVAMDFRALLEERYYFNAAENLNVTEGRVTTKPFYGGTEEELAGRLRFLAFKHPDTSSALDAVFAVLRTYPTADYMQELFAWILTVDRFPDFVTVDPASTGVEIASYVSRYLDPQNPKSVARMLQPVRAFIAAARKRPEIINFLNQYYADLAGFADVHVSPLGLPHTATPMTGHTQALVSAGARRCTESSVLRALSYLDRDEERARNLCKRAQSAKAQWAKSGSGADYNRTATLYREALNASHGNTYILCDLAGFYLQAGKRTGKNKYLQRAIITARQAVDLEGEHLDWALTVLAEAHLLIQPHTQENLIAAATACARSLLLNPSRRWLVRLRPQIARQLQGLAETLEQKREDRSLSETLYWLMQVVPEGEREEVRFWRRAVNGRLARAAEAAARAMNTGVLRPLAIQETVTVSFQGSDAGSDLSAIISRVKKAVLDGRCADALRLCDGLTRHRLTPDQRWDLSRALVDLRAKAGRSPEYGLSIEDTFDRLHRVDPIIVGARSDFLLEQYICPQLLLAKNDLNITEAEYWTEVFYCIHATDSSLDKRPEPGILMDTILTVTREVYASRKDFNPAILSFGLEPDMIPVAHTESLREISDVSGESEVALEIMPTGYHTALYDLTINRLVELAYISRYGGIVPRIATGVDPDRLRKGGSVVHFTNIHQDALVELRQSQYLPEVNFIVGNRWTRNIVVGTLGTVPVVSVKSGYLYLDGALTLARFTKPETVDYVHGEVNNSLARLIHRYRIPGTYPVHVLDVMNSKVNTHRALEGTHLRMPAYWGVDPYSYSGQASALAFQQDDSIVKFMQRYGQIVVKPSEGSGGSGIEVFNAGEHERALKHLQRIADSAFALVEEFIETPRLAVAASPRAWNARIFMVRAGDRGFRMVDAIVRAGDEITNISRGAKPYDLTAALGQLEGDARFSASEIRQVTGDLAVLSGEVIAACAHYAKYLCEKFYQSNPDAWLRAFGEDDPFTPDSIAVDFYGFGRGAPGIILNEVQAGYAMQWEADRMGKDIVTPDLMVAAEKAVRHRNVLRETAAFFSDTAKHDIAAQESALSVLRPLAQAEDKNRCINPAAPEAKGSDTRLYIDQACPDSVT